MALTANKYITVVAAPSGGEQITVSANFGDADIIANANAISNHIANTANPHSVSKNQVGLGNVNDTAQLNRLANDFSSFTVKASPVGADIILIEDSEDSGNKKYITITSLGIGGGGSPGGADTQVQYNDGGSFGGMAHLTYTKATGAISLNANASAGGDLEIKKETTGTVAFFDVSSGNIGIGSNTPNIDSEFGVIQIYTTSTAGISGVNTDFGASPPFNGWRLGQRSDGGVILTAHNREMFRAISSGEFLINAASTNLVSFRVVSDTLTHAFMVDAASGNVGVGFGAAALYPLHVSRSVDGGAVTLFLNNNFAAAASLDETSVLEFGFNGQGAARIISAKIGDYTSGPNRSASLEFWTITADTYQRHGVIDNVGKITLNVSALTGADLEVLKVTAGTALLVDVDNGQVSVNHDTPTSTLDVNGDIETQGDFYMGDPTTDGTWRFTKSGDDLLIQQREAGVYNTKSTISGA